MTAPRHRRRPSCRRTTAFTLIELLITISIVAIMASMVLFAFYSAQQISKEQKTKALITKLDAIIKAKWDSYQTRRVAINLPRDEFQDFNKDGQLQVGDYIDRNNDGSPSPGEWNDTTPNGIVDPGEIPDFNGNGTPDPGEALDNGAGSNRGNGVADVDEFPDYNGNGVADVYPYHGKERVDALRDLMRLELPDRWSDVVDDPVAPYGVTPKIARPAVSAGYKRKYLAAAGRSDKFQHAECLYLIVMSALSEEGDSRDVFRPEDVKDTDNDGLMEFVDAWGHPIHFLRWAPGFPSELNVVARGTVGNGSGALPTRIMTATGAELSQSSGAYNGGAMVATAAGIIMPKNMARITNYAYDVPSSTATFTFTTLPQTTGMDPFPGGFPPPNAFTILAPDPFDPTGVYPIYAPGATATAFPPGKPDTSVPSFAIYPLIFSSGPDGFDGIRADTGAGLHYADPAVALNPFVIIASDAMVGQPYGISPPSGEPQNGELDNIHNHMITAK